jgi:hypothetical protein
MDSAAKACKHSDRWANIGRKQGIYEMENRQGSETTRRNKSKGHGDRIYSTETDLSKTKEYNASTFERNKRIIEGKQKTQNIHKTHRFEFHLAVKILSGFTARSAHR